MPRKILLPPSSWSEKWYTSKDFYLNLVQRSLAELFGTMLFVFVGVLSTRDTDFDVRYDTTPSSVVAVALGHGLGLMGMIAAFGHISGGHFNPAVTTGAFIAGKINVLAAVFYVLAQFVGAICGSLLVLVLGIGHVTTGIHALGPNVSPGQGIFVEMMLTTFFVTTIINCAMDKQSDSKWMAPLGIGLALSASIMGGFHISGGSLNPARSFGPVVAASGTGSQVWQNHYVYWVGPLLGGIIAGTGYRFLFSSTPVIPLRAARKHSRSIDPLSIG